MTALFAAGACVALGGCFTGSDPAPKLAPQAAGGFGLFFQDEGSDVKLAYGVANSDDVGLMLECAKGSGAVQITDVARDQGPPSLLLVSSQGNSVLATSLQPNPEGQAPLLSAETSVGSPALAAFRRGGNLEVRNSGFRYLISATNAERLAVAQFFAACGPAKGMLGDRQV
jgi:hypothetical protein